MATGSPKTYFISYGFAEGRWHGRRLRASLEKRGFREAGSAKAASVLITHSGGCFLIPSDAKPALAVMIGTPFVPINRLSTTLIRKIWIDLRLHRQQGFFSFWLKKTVWSSLYSAIKMGQTARIIFHAARNQYVPKLASRTVLIRNTDDPFCGPEIANDKALSRHTHVVLAGSHDDLWINPEPYAELVEKYYA